MNRVHWLGLSIGLNLLLLLVIAWAATAAPRNQDVIAVQQQVTNRALRVWRLTNEIPSRVEKIDAPFHWSELESTDYRVYIANLRGIGCPERTIRDIIEAEVNALYLERVKALVDAVSGRFWHFMVNGEQFAKLVSEKQAELEAMDRERRELVATLLDHDEVHARALAELDAAEKLNDWKARLDFLSAEKVAAIHQAYLQFEQGRLELNNSAGNLSEDIQRNRLRELNAARDRIVAEALTPEELAEFKLRTSSAADVRHLTLDLELTFDEARALAQARMGKESEPQISAILGPERFAVYQRETDGDYQRTLRITERFDLPQETAVTLFDMRRAAEKLAREIREDRSRTDEERASILQAMEDETAQSIATLLGPAAFQTYQKYNGEWLAGFAE